MSAEVPVHLDDPDSFAIAMMAGSTQLFLVLGNVKDDEVERMVVGFEKCIRRYCGDVMEVTHGPNPHFPGRHDMVACLGPYANETEMQAGAARGQRFIDEVLEGGKNQLWNVN